MEEPNGIGYEGFAKWEQELAKMKAIEKKRSLDWTSINEEDLEQEFLLQIWLKRRTYQSHHQSKASLRTFMNRVLENRFLDILKAEKTDKRIIHEGMDSLQREFETEEGRSMTLEEKLADESLPESQDLNSDIQKAFEKAISALTIFQKDIYHRIQAGESLSDISKALKMPWSTIKDEVIRMRRVLYDAGLSDFIEPRDFPKKGRKG